MVIDEQGAFNELFTCSVDMSHQATELQRQRRLFLEAGEAVKRGLAPGIRSAYRLPITSALGDACNWRATCCLLFCPGATSECGVEYACIGFRQ